MELLHGSQAVFTTTLAVGSDETIYVGGYIKRGFGTVPVVAAIRDRGPNHQPQYVCDTPCIERANGAQFTHGIGLRGESGQTTRLYVTTANLGTVIFNAKEEGELYAVDPASGSVLAEYDPSDVTSPQMSLHLQLEALLRPPSAPTGLCTWACSVASATAPSTGMCKQSSIMNKHVNSRFYGTMR